MPSCDWLQHCNFLAGIEILPIALQTACKPCGFAAGKPAIVAGPVLRVAIGESCSVCRALKSKTMIMSTTKMSAIIIFVTIIITIIATFSIFFVCLFAWWFFVCVFVFVFVCFFVCFVLF